MNLNKFLLFIVSIIFSCASIAANPSVFENSVKQPLANGDSAEKILREMKKEVIQAIEAALNGQ